MKIAKVTPLFKNSDLENIRNNWSISVFLCFSKVLVLIMYKRFYKYFWEEKLWYSRQYGFQKCDSTDDAIVHLFGQIYESFENDNFTLGVFMDLSKAFDTIDHSIFIQFFKCACSKTCLQTILIYFFSRVTSTHHLRQLMTNWLRSSNDSQQTSCH